MLQSEVMCCRPDNENKYNLKRKEGKRRKGSRIEMKGDGSTLSAAFTVAPRFSRSAANSSWLCLMAICRGVTLLAFGCCMSAPPITNRCAHSISPVIAEMWSGVMPSLIINGDEDVIKKNGRVIRHRANID